MGLIKWTFKRRIDNLTQEKVNRLLPFLDEELKNLKVDIRRIDGHKLFFKNNFFNGQGRNHLMAPVDSGEIFFDINTGKFCYKISVTRMFLILCVMCVFFILVLWNAPRFIPVSLVIWLIGINMIIARIRHGIFASKLKKLISTFIKEFDAGDIQIENDSDIKSA